MKDSISMTSYDVFPGITVIYNDICAERVSGRHYESGSVFEINHCRRGRIEYELAEGGGDEFRYLAPGDLSISCRTDFREDAYFPLRYYQGITILIDTGQTPGCLSCFLDDVEVHPELLMKKFDNNGRGYITRSNESIEHIFSELYSVPEEIKKGYLKVKILELLLFLSAMEPEAAEETKMVSAAHARLAKDICRYLTERMDRKVTLDMLAETFHVSATLIKTCFKDVYGVSVYSYIRTQKMEKAAVMLRETDMQVTEIAGTLGYDNSSKFAKAFKDVKGVTRGYTGKNRGFNICPNGALSVLFGVAGRNGKYYNINVKCLRAFHFGTELAYANQIERIRLMSVVIIGGNERMERRYKELCESYSCKTKVFTKKAGNMKNLGSPDLLVMFTDTMSHKMLKAVMSEARGRNIRIAHSKSSSMAALKSILDEHIEGEMC